MKITTMLILTLSLFASISRAQSEMKQIKEKASVATDAEFDHYVKSWTDREMNWSGIVSDVSKSWGGDTYLCIIKTDDGRVNFSMIESEALKLKKDYKIGFRGTIEGIRKGIFGGITVDMKKVTIMSMSP